MSFSRSGSTAPAFSFPIGYGTFTDINVSNTVFASFFRGDGGFLSNISSSIPGTLPNLVVSNSLTVTNVFATRMNVSSVVTPLANVGTLNVAQVSNLSSLALTTANVGTLNVGQISNLSSLSTTLYGPHLGSNVASFLNVYSANALTTTNVFVTSGLDVGPGTLGTNVCVFSNASGGSNVTVMNSLGNVGIATSVPAYPLDVGTTVNIPTGTGGETIRSKGPLIIGNGLNDGNRFISALDTSLTAGNSRYITFGKTNSLYNQAELSYTHIGDGSLSNRVNIGLLGVSTASFLANGNVGIGVGTPSATLQVVGNAYVSNALSTTNVFATSVVPTVPISFRNRVINGDFIIDQRNNGAATTPGSGKTQVIDRWKVEIAGTGRCQVGQNLGAITSPPGFTSYFGLKVTTTTSVGAGDYLFFGQVIEGINTIDFQFGTSGAKPITLSFWVYSSIAGTGGGFLRNAGTTAGGYSRSYPFTFTINNTNTWEYKTITLPGDTTGTWYAGQVDGLEFGIEMWNGTNWQGAPGSWLAGNYTGPTGGTINYAGTLNSYLYVTGFQIEQGLLASVFERRHINYELAACQRYYEPSIARLGGYNLTNGALRSSVYFNVKKRPAPSPTFTVVSQLENSNLGTLAFDNSNYDQSSARFYSAVITAGDAYGQWKVSVDAEF